MRLAHEKSSNPARQVEWSASSGGSKDEDDLLGDRTVEPFRGASIIIMSENWSARSQPLISVSFPFRNMN